MTLHISPGQDRTMEFPIIYKILFALCIVVVIAIAITLASNSMIPIAIDACAKIVYARMGDLV